MRIKKIPRESASIVIMRKKGQSINNLSKFFGRSTSFISRILKFNGLNKDLRKLPTRIGQRIAMYQRFYLENLRDAWQKFIIGESERPP